MSLTTGSQGVVLAQQHQHHLETRQPDLLNLLILEKELINLCFKRHMFITSVFYQGILLQAKILKPLP